MVKRNFSPILVETILFAFAVGCSQSNPAGSPAPGPASNCRTAGLTAVSSAVIRNNGDYKKENNQNNPVLLKKLIGHVPAAVKQASETGAVGEEQSLSVSIALNLNNENELNQVLSDIYNPRSTSYHHFLTSEEFNSRYSPTEDQVNQVKTALETNGVTVTSVETNRLIIHAQGPVGVMNTLFHTEVHNYTAKLGRKFYAPAYEIQVPLGLNIQAVHGLDNFMQAHSHLKKKTLNSPKGGTGSSGGFAPADIKTAYSVPSQLTGSGQVLALLELDGYTSSDVSHYESTFGLPNVPLQNVLVDGVSNQAGAGAAEVTLDIELMIALAPGVQKILVYEGPNSSQGILDTYNKIASDNLAQSISTSWGASESDSDGSFLQTENTIFKQMATQGQTIYAAAGDSGAYDDGSTLSVDDPASQPYVVGVGGTQLTTNSDQSYSKEITWGSGSSGGGGGISSVWSIPTWQTGVVGTNSKGSTTMRNVPDVSLNADPNTGYAIYYSGQWTIYGGTSCAAPLWAAFTALVNEQRLLNNLTVLGFPTPAIYQIGQGKDYVGDFHDISDGSTNLYYPAVTGYDEATGWGSFQGGNLLLDLANTPAATPSPTSTVTAGTSGSTNQQCN